MDIERNRTARGFALIGILLSGLLLLPNDCEGDVIPVDSAGSESNGVRHIVNSCISKKYVHGDTGIHRVRRDQSALKSVFKTENVITNATYKDCSARFGDDIDDVDSFAARSEVKCQRLSFPKMQLAKYMAFEFMCKDARSEKLLNWVDGPEAVFDFPRPLHDDFEYCGYPYFEYDLDMIPFVVLNEKKCRVLEEVLCKFHCAGKFVFALYVNLNDFSVAPDFVEGAKAGMLLEGISLYPFLDGAESTKQKKFVSDVRERQSRIKREKAMTDNDVSVDVDA